MEQMTDRMQTVIDAAERAATAIRQDAEEQARRHLDEAQRKADRMTAERVRLISELTDDLIRHAGTVRDHSEQMIHALEDAIRSVHGKLGEPASTRSIPLGQAPSTYQPSPPITSFEPRRPAQSSVAAPPEAMGETPRHERSWREAGDSTAHPYAAESSGIGAVSQEALLRATRLAVAGNDRDSIARALRVEHGITDPDPVVDRVLGED